MTGLEIELILRLLAHGAQVRPQACFSNSLGVVVVILLPLYERLHIDRRNNPWFVAQLTPSPANKVCAEARLHANDARRELFEGLDQRQSLDLPTKSNSAVSAEPNNVENFLANVDADRGQGRHADIHGLLLQLLRCSPCRLSPRVEQPVHPINGRTSF